jgi:hypothetical protein
MFGFVQVQGRRIIAIWAIAFQSLSAQRTAQYDKTGLFHLERPGSLGQVRGDWLCLL